MPFDGIAARERESERTRRLRAARALIDTEDKWLQGQLTDGNMKFCALGALYRVRATAAFDLVAKHATFIGHDAYNHHGVTARSSPSVKIAGHNNMLGHAATMEMFDRAIAESVQLDLMVG